MNAQSLEELAFGLSLRSLDRQERVVEELRARTGVLLAATALVASFLGGRALASDATPWITLPGVAASVASIVLAVYLIAPKSKLEFALDGAAVYEHFVREGGDLVEAQRTLAYWVSDAWNSNQSVIDGLVRLFAIACAALIAAVLLWALALGLD